MPKYTKFLGPLTTFRRKVPVTGPLADMNPAMVFDHTQQMDVFPKKLGAAKQLDPGYRTTNRSGTAAQARVSSPFTPRDNQLK